MLHAIAPDLFRSERLPIRVVTDSSERDGQTLIDEEVGAMVDVLMQANVEETLALAFELLSGLP
jgi:purine nucleosidase/pyrimidine-specific ribonucleoside hydrolase